MKLLVAITAVIMLAALRTIAIYVDLTAWALAEHTRATLSSTERFHTSAFVATANGLIMIAVTGSVTLARTPRGERSDESEKQREYLGRGYTTTQFSARWRTNNMARWHRVKVTIDLGDEEQAVFDAYTQGDSWNGWGLPFFTAEEGQRIADWTHRQAAQSPEGIETVTWADARQAFVLEDPQYHHKTDEPIPDEDIVDGVAIEELGLTLYGIGAYKWAWETLTTPSAV